MNTTNKTERCQTLSQFGNMICYHARMAEIRECALMNLEIGEHDDSRLSAVYGPAGAGKSTLGKDIQKVILERERPAMMEDPSYLPVVMLKVFKTPEVRATWKTNLLRLLALYDDLKSKRSIVDISGKGKKDERTNSALTEACITQIRERRTKLVILDEAQDLIVQGQGLTERGNLNTLKSICNDSETQCLLLGPAKLGDLLVSDDQLARRSSIHYYGAYNTDEKERRSFMQAYLTLCQASPLPIHENVPLDLISVGSLQCVGLLKGWLSKAIRLAAAQKSPVVTKEHLEKTRFLTNVLDTFIKEMQKCDNISYSSSDTEINIRRYMGIETDEKQKTPRKKREYSPGIRFPKRDTL